MKKLLLVIFVFLLSGCTNDYMCLNGYKFNESDKTCTRVVSEEATLEFYCETKTDKLEEEKCKTTTLTPAKIEKVCNKGYALEGTRCVKDGTVVNFIKCGTDRTFSNSTLECYDKINAITIYRCEKGNLDKTSCVEISYSDASSKYVCKENYKIDDKNMCHQTIVMNAVKIKN